MLKVPSSGVIRDSCFSTSFYTILTRLALDLGFKGLNFGFFSKGGISQMAELKED